MRHFVTVLADSDEPSLLCNYNFSGLEEEVILIAIIYYFFYLFIILFIYLLFYLSRLNLYWIW